MEQIRLKNYLFSHIHILHLFCITLDLKLKKVVSNLKMLTY